MIENNINNYVFIAIFLLYNKMLSGQKKIKKIENGSRDEVPS